MQVATAIHSAGIDWLTAYVPAASEEVQGQLAELMYSLEVKAIGGGAKVIPIRFNGYEGTRVAGVGVAYNSEGAMVVHIPGSLAGVSAYDALRIGARPSRIDLQVTVLTAREMEGVADRAARMSHHASLKSKTPWHPTLINTFGKGNTAYIGSQSSDQFARIYNKAKESKHTEYANCWRYELVLRNERAIHAGREVLKSDNPVATIIAMVYDWLLERGVETLFDRGSIDYNMYKPETSDDLNNKLIWIKRAVVPVIINLLIAGKVEEVKQALPLENLIQSCSTPPSMLPSAYPSVKNEIL